MVIFFLDFKNKKIIPEPACLIVEDTSVNFLDLIFPQMEDRPRTPPPQ